MAQFDIAYGRCILRDETLVIERTDPTRLSRRELLHRGIRTNLEYRPYSVIGFIAVMLFLGGLFFGLLGYLYSSNPSVAPLVVALASSGIIVVVGGVELSLRRSMRYRRTLRSALAEEFSVAESDRIRLEDVRGVTVRERSLQVPRMSGHQMLIHFERNGEEVTAAFGFPRFMAEAMASARAAFERHGIPIESERP